VTTQPTKDQKTLWELKYKDTEIEFVCHNDGAVYLSFDWNGTMVWDLVGCAGNKSFPNWLRQVADRMEKKP
jgi:hypothetical protein